MKLKGEFEVRAADVASAVRDKSSISHKWQSTNGRNDSLQLCLGSRSL